MNQPLRSLVLALTIAGLHAAPSTAAEAPTPTFADDFSAGDARWQPYFDAGKWSISEDLFHSASPEENSARLARLDPAADVMIEAEVRAANEGRRNFGLVLRARGENRCLVVRYYDHADKLTLLRYDGPGQPTQAAAASEKIGLKPGQWYRMRAAAFGGIVVAKIWPMAGAEPDWQARFGDVPTEPGLLGLIAQDTSRVDFGNVRIWSGPGLEEMRQTLAGQQARLQEEIAASLTLELEATPLVLRDPAGPMRLLACRTLVDGKSHPAAGTLKLSVRGKTQQLEMEPSAFVGGAFPVRIAEPASPTAVEISLRLAGGRTLDARCEVKPARPWTFYMTPHTHYDIGFTHPQPEVIERLTNDMDLAVQYCEETADWPAESRYRWTVECTALMRNYIERRSPEQVEKFMKWVRDGRIEICGFNFNMPTELVGHEELIRCLYDTACLREQYRVPIDTVMINDVPGYTWALPELLVEAGIPRVSFRANSIRGQFLWYRPGAVPRPCYWEGPEGSRVFMWYTDSYREGNFFRAPGLHEASFLGIIGRNEGANCQVDHIQLRMGGDNLPPDLNASKNARAWNEKYIWPRVLVATNREFLETLERQYGGQCKTFRGDIPSWWAEGPASSARETGINRLVHDKLTAAEMLWTRLWLDGATADYPAERIADAYWRMFLYDEHTWGASSSISEPKGRNTLDQWKWKASNAYAAVAVADRLLEEAVARLSEPLTGSGRYSLAVWNTLAWPRNDVVTFSTIGSPFDGAPGLRAIDNRSGKAVPVQLSRDRSEACFVARDVPPGGCAIFRIERSEKPADAPTAKNGTLENGFYRITASEKSAGLSSWYDKSLKRELLDTKAAFAGNQPLHEKLAGPRNIVDSKKPTPFERTAAAKAEPIEQTSGPVYQEMTQATSLPGCPRILQTVRVYSDLKLVDITNVVDKDDIVDPEGVYFAFPFDVASPEFRVQIADATMRPGIDQLTYSCFDFYSIQHWLTATGKTYSIQFVPVEAPLVVLSDLNVYKWADRLEFDKGHVYSLVMNNYWYTNFCASQSGTLTFRYRLTSSPPGADGVTATHFAWQPFHPLQARWLTHTGDTASGGSKPFVRLTGDPVVVGCVKRAERGEAVIVRLLEMNGRNARCRVALDMPDSARVTGASLATALETQGEPLPVSEDGVEVQLRANEIVTVRLEVKRPATQADAGK